MTRTLAPVLLLLSGCLGDPPALPQFSEAETTGGVEDPSTTDPSTTTTTAQGSSETTAPGSAESESGGPAESSSGDATPPRCGDGQLDPGELCDDGNADDFDACTTLCQPPRCDDGLHSGDELGLDCGGACAPCTICETHDACGPTRVCDAKACRLPHSCAELYVAHPELDDGPHELSPPAARSPFQAQCRHDEEGGLVWTEVFTEDPADGVHPDWQLSGSGVSGAGALECGDLGWVLGLFGSGAQVQIGVELRGVPHTEVRALGEVLVADTWDAEQIAVRVDGTQVWAETCEHGQSACGLGRGHHCGIGAGDGLTGFDGRTPHTQDQAVLRFEANINSFQDDESWGVGAFRVGVR